MFERTRPASVAHIDPRGHTETEVTKPCVHKTITDANRITSDPRWTSLCSRDPAARGKFVYAVTTTGVYCHPGSASRLPRAENVRFFDSALAAEAAGYRASKRPGTDHKERIVQACRRIATDLRPPSLNSLASEAGLSSYHFHRIFKSLTGLTPHAYALAHRADRLRAQLHASRTITDAIYQSGFTSGSRFYEATDQVLGMKPRTYRAGGSDARILFAVGQCALGAILVAQSQRGVCAISLGDDPQALVLALQDCFPRAQLVGGDAQFEARIAHIVGFIESPAIGLDLPLDVRGTAFQMRVWNALRKIPLGTTQNYAQIAASIGSPRAVRAVAGACAANPVALAIPCHRVVRSDGELSGYRWGVARKREILARERLAVEPLVNSDC